MHYRPGGEPLAPHALPARPGEPRRGKGLEILRTQLVHRGVHQRALRVEDQPQPAVRSSLPSRWRWFGLPCLAPVVDGLSGRRVAARGPARPRLSPRLPSRHLHALPPLLRQARDGTADAL